MASLDFIRYQQYENWLALVCSIAATVEGLQDYTRTKLKFIQDNVNNKLKNCGALQCNSNRSCSEYHKNNFRAWCIPCQKWRNELRKYYRGINSRIWDSVIKWERINSFLWRSELEEIAKVFVHMIPDSNVIEDLTSLMSLFRNCTELFIDDPVRMDALNIRNKYFGHNFKLKLTENEKSVCIDKLKRILQTPVVAATGKAKKALEQLSFIQRSTKLSQDIIDANTKQICLKLFNSRISDMKQTGALCISPSVDTKEQTSRFKNKYPDEVALEYLEQRKRELCDVFQITMACYVVVSLCSAIMWIVIIYCIASFYNYESDRSEFSSLCEKIKKGDGVYIMDKQSNCLEMVNKDEFPEWNFFEDVKDLYDETIIERKWLSPILQEKLKNSKKGVLFTSDMGLGKSSIISLLVCSSTTSIWYDLRTTLLSYHLCRYDVQTTKQPHIFIQNIAAVLMKRYEEFRIIIQNDDVTDWFVIDLLCKQDPIGCLERIVLRPLKRIWHSPINETELLIVLDAADECSFNDGRLDIVSLISQRLTRFPNGLKFLITSRDLLKVKNYLIDLYGFEMQSFVSEISSDLLDYAKVQHNSNNKRQVKIEDLVKVSEGNFLLLKYLIDSNTVDSADGFYNTTSSLFQFYTANLRRIFGQNGDKYDRAKTLFEIICTSTNPVSIDEDLSIFTESEPDKIDKRTLMSYLRNDMRHFLKFSGNTFTLLHKSIKDFFESLPEESPFYIEFGKGHERIARYLLKNLSSNDWIQTAFHIEKSKIKVLVDEFARSIDNMNVENVSLINAVSMIDSDDIMQIIWEKFHGLNVDSLDNQDETPVFIASKLGYLRTLDWLVKKGADIAFVKRFNYSSEFTSALSCKYVYFCEYGLLEIAAQNGHLSIVEYLLTKNQNLLKHKTAFGLTAFDLACENGHLNTARYIASQNSSLINQHSLYLASQNGHLKIADMILNFGVKDKCVPCSSLKEEPENESSYPLLLDNSHLVVCETALHVAVRNCHSELVKLLVQKSRSWKKCVDIYGMTPLLSSVRHKCEKAFKILHENGANTSDVCRKNIGLTIHHLDDVIRQDYKRDINEKICPEGWGIVHFIAVSNDLNLANYLKSNGFSNWDIRDKNGVTPFHLAHCYMDFDTLYFWKDLVQNKMVDMSKSSLNGSTPHHTTALCRNPVSFMLHHCPFHQFKRYRSFLFNLYFYIQCVLNFSLGDGIPNALDNKTNSILHYFFLTNKHELLDLDLLDWYEQIDVLGNHALHYAVVKRRFEEAETIMENLSEIERISVLEQINFHKRNLLDHSFSGVSSGENTYINRLIFERAHIINCSLTRILDVSCVPSNFISLYYSWQKSFLFHLVKAHSELNIAFNTSNLLYLAAKKSDLFGFILLRRYFKHEFTNITSNYFHVRSLIKLLASDSYSLAFLALIGESGLCCHHKAINDFSAIVYSDEHDNMMWVHFENEHIRTNGTKGIFEVKSNYEFGIYKEYLYKMVFNHKNLKCLNLLHTDGYNFLHKSVMEGNLMAVKELINAGADLTIPTKMGQHVLDIVLQHAPYMDSEMDFENKAFQEMLRQYDDMASFLLFQIKRKPNHATILKKSNFCTQNNGHVYIAAAKGLLQFLKGVYDIFGKDIIFCRDNFGMTPLSFAFDESQHHVIEWIATLKSSN